MGWHEVHNWACSAVPSISQTIYWYSGPWVSQCMVTQTYLAGICQKCQHFFWDYKGIDVIVLVSHKIKTDPLTSMMH